MTDTNEAEALPPDDGDPAAAFDALRAEVAALRERIEGMPNLTLPIAVVGKGMAAVDTQLRALNKHPALAMTPDHFAAAVEAAGNRALSESLAQLAQGVGAVERMREHLATTAGALQAHRATGRRVILAGVVGMLVGVVALAVLLTVLPAPWQAGLFSSLARDRWQTGAAIMQTADPDTWHRDAQAARLIEANRATLAACQAAHEQRCTLLLIPNPR